MQERGRKKTNTTERRSFGKLLWPEQKDFYAGGGCKSPIQAQTPYLPPRFSCGPHSFGNEKLPHWIMVVYGFFFPARGMSSHNKQSCHELRRCFAPPSMRNLRSSFWQFQGVFPYSHGISAIFSRLQSLSVTFNHFQSLSFMFNHFNGRLVNGYFVNGYV